MNILNLRWLQKAQTNGSLTTFGLKREYRTKYVGPTVVAFRFRFPVPRQGIPRPPPISPIFLCIHRMINKREVLVVLSHSLTASLISKHVDISIKNQKRQQKIQNHRRGQLLINVTFLYISTLWDALWLCILIAFDLDFVMWLPPLMNRGIGRDSTDSSIWHQIKIYVCIRYWSLWQLKV